MKRIRIPLLFLLALFSACSNWLDVKPEDKFIEEEVFDTPQGFMDALNGIYLNLGASKLYGSELSIEVPDMLAQYYYLSVSHGEGRRALADFNFEEASVKARIDAIWTNMYVNITNINKFIENIATYGDVLDEQSRAIMLGEAYAARAYLYFDLVRLFAPAYAVDAQAKTIPYYDKTTYEAAPYLTTATVIEKILADLQRADDLLKTMDPALVMNRVDQTTGNVDIGNRPYLQFRNYHFNYYAVKAMQARVLLYAERKSEALAVALVVMDSGSKFPWISSSELSNEEYPNRVFSPEILFAFENPRLYNSYEQLFNPALMDNVILASGPNFNFLNAVYDGWENDFRYTSNWRVTGGKTYPVFLKYRDLSATTGRNYRFTIAGLRLSEVYLIAAECESDPEKAQAYLNELRTHRNCAALDNLADLSTNIMREYRREFYGEGQLWFYYKRTQQPSILSATTMAQKQVALEDYTFPIPLSETEPR